MKERKLSLKKESVTELGRHDLGRVVGGSGTCISCIDCITTIIAIDEPDIPTDGCFTHHSTLDCLTRELCQK